MSGIEAQDEDLRVEADGETVGEAKWAAVRELERLAPGVDRDAVRFQVVSEGERGLLGVGYAPAHVIATAPRPPAAPATTPAEDESDEAALAREVAVRIAAGIGVTCTATVSEDDERVVVTLTGPDLGILIGRHGQMIDAIQYLANAIAHHRSEGERRQIVIDASGYRERRATVLESLARRAAERAVGTGSRVELDPMTAVERKVVHEVLKDDPEVETTSEGTEPNRFVVVIPRRSAD